MRKKTTLVGILVISTLLLSVAWLFPAYHFLHAYRERLSSDLFEKPPLPREIWIAEAKLNIQFYPQERSSSSLILVPGLHPEGVHEPRFVAFAESVAAAGFNVIAADIVEFRNFQITTHAVDQLVQLVKALPRYVPENSLRNLGMLGVSYGVGPIFAAAADAEVKPRVHFLVSIGGYSQLQRAIDFMLSGNYLPNGNSREVHPWGRLIFAMNNIDELVDAPDAAILKGSLRLRLNLKEEAAREKENKLSGDGKRFLREILEGLSENRLEQFRKILRRQDRLMDQLSPEVVLKDLNPQLRIYLLHGQKDDLIPYEETLELAQKLKTSGDRNVRALLVDSLIHVDVLTAFSLRDTLNLLFWTRALLGES